MSHRSDTPSPSKVSTPPDQTVADSAPGSLNALGETIWDDASPLSGTPDLPTFAASSLSSRLDGSRDQPSARYDSLHLIGTGASSHVYAASDRHFNRSVAIKVAHGTRHTGTDGTLAKFLREARLTAQVEHPGVVPVYDLDQTCDGDLCFTMRLITGRSLGDAIRSQGEGEQVAEIANTNALINVFLKIADVLRCAHAQGIVHRDLKPDNIMLGRFGEVVVVDWGSALILADDPTRGFGRRVGTPYYMSPEQARGDGIDARADVYSIGATLFHALLKRAPLIETDLERFWQRKRHGIYTPPSPEERAQVPRRLLAIAEKAMAADVADRYQSIAAMAEDLSNFQSGAEVAACPDTWWESAWRWHRAHWRGLYSGLCIATLAASLTALLWQQHRSAMARWGQPVCSEDFSGDSWERRWHILKPGGYELHRGAIVSTGQRANVAFLDQRLFGPTAIEFTAWWETGADPGDLSAVWYEGDLAALTNDRDWFRSTDIGYRFQLGAYDNTCACLVRSDHQGQHVLMQVPYQLVHGQRYRIRVEIDGKRVVIEVNGRQVIDYQGFFPIGAGFVGLYGYYPGKSFDDILIRSKGIPERVSAIAIGDEFFLEGHYKQAQARYQKIAEAHPGTDLGGEALFKVGLAQLRQQDSSAARSTWARINHPHWHAVARLHASETPHFTGDHAAAINELAGTLAEDPQLRIAVASRWSGYVSRLQIGDPSIPAYLAFQERHLADLPVTYPMAARALVLLGRHEEVLSRYPDDHVACSQALNYLERYEDVLRRPRTQPNRAYALMQLGRLREVLLESPPGTIESRQAHIALGESEKAYATELAAGYGVSGEILMALGRLDEVTREPFSPDMDPYLIALVHLGRADEALTHPLTASNRHAYAIAWLASGRDDAMPNADEADQSNATLHQALLRRIAGDGAGARSLLAALPPNAAQRPPGHWLEWMLIPAALAALDGDGAAWNAVMDAEHRRGPNRQMQMPWHLAAFLTRRIDADTVLAQPCAAWAPALLLLGTALRSDLDGDAKAAHDAYRRFLAIPSWQRPCQPTMRPTPTLDAFVRWRLDETSRP